MTSRGFIGPFLAQALLGLVAWIAVATAAVAAPWETDTAGLHPVPPLATRVTDLTDTLSASDRGTIEQKLADWEARTGNQLAVLIVPSVQPEPIEGYALRVAEAWKIGRRGQDNGVLFLIAKNDKKMRLEVGYGLEGSLTDATSRRIIAETVAPLFGQGRFAAGIEAGIDRIVQVVGTGQPLPEASRPAKSVKSAARGFDLGTLAVLAFIAVPVIGGILRSLFGKLVGSTLGAGAIGAVAWWLMGSLVLAIVAGIVAFVVMIFSGIGGALARSHGMGIPIGGWGGGGFGGGSWGGGGSGGGFSGGGGSFGGGGASGGWN